MQCKRRIALLITSVGLCSACAQTAARVYSAGAVRDGGSDADIVTARDLARTGDSRSVLEALEHARPSFLGARGRLPAVSLDESLVTDISILSTLSVSDICEIRLQRATSGAGHAAVLVNGAISSGDVLLVRTRGRATTGCGRDPVTSGRN